MWVNAQREGRPAEYRCRCSTPQSLADAHYWSAVYSSAAKTRNPLKFAGMPQTNETISAASEPKFTIVETCGGVIAA